MSLALMACSNAPWAPTGYGQQMAQLTRHLVADDVKVMIAANYGLEATTTEWEGAAVYPRGLDMFCNDVVEPYYLDWKAQHPDRVASIFTLYDVWVYSAPAFDKYPTASWVPVDHVPAPAGVVEFLRKPTVLPIAMSQFGMRQLNAAGLDAAYVPHAIDTAVFRPTESIPSGDGRVTGRQMMKIADDRFVVGCFNANKGTNPSRKAWPEAIMGFAAFARTRPDAVLYLHTDRDGGMGGLKLPELVAACGLRDDQVVYANQYLLRMGYPPEAVAALMSACDVGLLSTMGEGFGITAIEMQACGVPVILNDFSAQPELLGDGWLTSGQPWWDAAHRAWFSTPNIGSIVDCLEAAYDRGRERSDKARRFVVDNYDDAIVYRNQWRPVLAEIEARAAA